MRGSTRTARAGQWDSLRDGHHSFTRHVMGILALPVTKELEEIVMFGGLAAGFAHLVKPTNSAQGQASDKRRRV